MQSQVELSLAEILSGLANETPATPVEAIPAEIIDEIRLKNLIELYGDFTKIYCQKSGAVLNDLGAGLINKYLATMRRPKASQEEQDEILMRAIELMQRQAISCSPLWLRTDAEHLDALMIHDPLGYFIFAASHVVCNFSPIAKLPMHIKHYMHSPSGRARLECFIEYRLAVFQWTLQKAKCRKLLEQYPIERIHYANKLLRTYCALFDHKNGQILKPRMEREPGITDNNHEDNTDDMIDETPKTPKLSKYDHNYEELLDINLTFDGEFLDEKREMLPAIGRNLDEFILRIKNTMDALIKDAMRRRRINPKEKISWQTVELCKPFFGPGYSNFALQGAGPDTEPQTAKATLINGLVKSLGISEFQFRVINQNAQNVMQNGKIFVVPEGRILAKIVQRNPRK